MLAVIGAGIIRYDQVTNHFWTGLILVQLSNISFAIGMVGYKRLMETRPMPQHNAFAWFYIGAFSGAGGCLVDAGTRKKMPQNFATVGHPGLSWRGGHPGLVTFMWTTAPPMVDAGTLGIMNNMHVPAGLLVNLAIWQTQPAGRALLLALW